MGSHRYRMQHVFQPGCQWLDAKTSLASRVGQAPTSLLGSCSRSRTRMLHTQKNNHWSAENGSAANVRQKLVLRMYTFMPPRLPIASEYDVEDRSRYLQTSAHQYSKMMRRNHAGSFLTKDRRRSLGRCERMNIIDMKWVQ